MNTWVERAKVDTVCTAKDCDLAFVEGQMVVMIRRPPLVASFHADCWLKVAQTWLEDGLETAPKPGRRKLDLSVEDKLLRMTLMRRYAATKQRILRYQERVQPGDEVTGEMRMRILRLYVIQERLKMEINEVGGPPRSWLEPVKIPEFVTKAAA